MAHQPTSSLEKMFMLYFSLTQRLEIYVINLVIPLNFSLFVFLCVENSKGIAIVPAVLCHGVTVCGKPVRRWHFPSLIIIWVSMVLERNKILWRGSSCEYVGEQEPSAVVLGHSPSWRKPDGERLRSWRGEAGGMTQGGPLFASVALE